MFSLWLTTGSSSSRNRAVRGYQPGLRGWLAGGAPAGPARGPAGPGCYQVARFRAASPFAGPFAPGLSHALLSDDLSLRHGVLWFRLWPPLGQPPQHPRPVARARPAVRIGDRFPGTTGRLGLAAAGLL